MAPSKAVKLAVFIKYEPHKMDEYWRLPSGSTIVWLRRHLTALRLGHPKSDNVELVADGVRMYWETKDQSYICGQYARVVEAQNDDAMKETMGRCFIQSFAMSVTPITNAPLLLPVSTRRDSLSNGPAHESASSSSASNNDPAQQFLDGLDFGPLKIKREEPESPRFHFTSRRAVYVPSSTGSSRYESPRPLPSMDFDAARQNVSETVDNGMDGLMQSTPATPRLTPEDEDAPMDISPAVSPIPGLVTLRQPKSAPKAEVFDEPMPEDVPQDDERTTYACDPIVEQLSRALQDIRKEVASGLVKEAALLQALKKLGAPDITVRSAELNPHNNFISKLRVQLLETELQNERQKREEAEELVQEVVRERKVPFVVPALMEAFIAISKLTTQALETSDTLML
ncbi:hypothetical protein C8J57DRAFT_362124 [Mycena rebaudengoi]|nr:hypothetical protein C8J57DRAFT_362124 [Mycena rebaudengoi]